MYRYIISSLIAFVMIATVFLAWSPQAKGQDGVCSDCCQYNLDRADCFCASKFGGWMRQVRCTTDPVCATDTTVGYCDCQIRPVKCYRGEERKVLLKFEPRVSFDPLPLPIDCGDCGAEGCVSAGGGCTTHSDCCEGVCCNPFNLGSTCFTAAICPPNTGG